MEIKSQIAKEEYFAFNRDYYLKRKIGMKIFLSFLVSFWIVIYTLNKTQFSPWNWLLGLILGLSFLSIFTLLPYFLNKRNINKSAKKENLIGEEKTFKIIDDGLNIESKKETIFLGWDKIRLANEINGVLFFITSSYKTYLLPKKFFETDLDAQSFLGTIQNGILNSNRKWHPQRFYWFGLLGFIPILGGIVGVILLLIGIFKFKDKLLMLIGSICIVFSIQYYVSLFKFIQQGFGLKPDFSFISKTQMNGLIKEIEFYKVQHGSYPDSLEQTENNVNYFASSYDPSLTENTSKTKSKYRYQKVGDKYRLFSAGRDGINNTADDIYPKIIKTDSSKIGWIK